MYVRLYSLLASLRVSILVLIPVLGCMSGLNPESEGVRIGLQLC